MAKYLRKRNTIKYLKFKAREQRRHKENDKSFDFLWLFEMTDKDIWFHEFSRNRSFQSNSGIFNFHLAIN